MLSLRARLVGDPQSLLENIRLSNPSQTFQNPAKDAKSCLFEQGHVIVRLSRSRCQLSCVRSNMNMLSKAYFENKITRNSNKNFLRCMHAKRNERQTYDVLVEIRIQWNESPFSNSRFKTADLRITRARYDFSPLSQTLQLYLRFLEPL